MVPAKKEVQELLSRLPDESTIEEIQYHLYVFEKVRRGLGAAEIEGAISHEEAETRLADKFVVKPEAS